MSLSKYFESIISQRAKNRLLGLLGLSVLALMLSPAVNGATWNPLVDTGHDICYDGFGQVLTPCPVAGEPFYGQDANYRGAAAPNYQDNLDGTITDLNTDLMWFKRDDDQDYLLPEALAHCGNSTLGGHTDWRLPNIFELGSLHYLGSGPKSGKFYSSIFELNDSIYNTNYWSSTPVAERDFQWAVPFDTSQLLITFVHTNSYYFALCVRGTETPLNQYTDNGVTVTSDVTHLEWQKTDDGVKRDWEEALAYCEGLNLNDTSDWRLPNYKELLSIVDWSQVEPAIDTTYFSALSEPYWSSSSDVGGMAGIGVDFQGGFTWRNLVKKDFIDEFWGHVYLPAHRLLSRCVRGGLLKEHDVTVMQAGSGSGTIQSGSGKINCSLDNCGYRFPKGTVITLTATPDAGSAFAVWAGTFTGISNCEGDSGVCTITVEEDTYIQAYFQTLKTLTVTKTDNGVYAAKIISEPAGINCGVAVDEDCSETYLYSKNVTLTAVPGHPQVVFTGWSGDCTGSADSCVVYVNDDKNVTGTFAYLLTAVFHLDVTKTGTGAGKVTSIPAGIDCGDNCSKGYPSDTSVALTAVPSTGSRFSGWSADIGACTPSDTTCTVTMDQLRYVDAEFSVNPKVPQPLAVSIIDGPLGHTGSVSSKPAGISCGRDCYEEYARNTQVTLTASPATGAAFVGWSGDTTCGSNPTCTLYVDHYRLVKAEFGVAPPQINVVLTAAKAGDGVGTITSSPAGINCGNDCGEVVTSGTEVTLTATPAGGTGFTGWSGGGCFGLGDCVVTPGADTTVTATFTINPIAPQELTVTRDGVGSVVSTPAGIDCGLSCSAGYDYDEVVALDAQADVGHTFLGWSSSSGECMSDPFNCFMILDMAKSIKAMFEPDYEADLLCAGDTPIIEQHLFPAGNNFRCEAATSITLQNDVTARGNSQVEVVAPVITINGPFSIQSGAIFRVNQP